ncbi:MAG: MerR family transcriptional regulator [Pseudomonadales bacterium]
MNAIKMKELESRTGVGREAIRFYIREGMIPQPDKPKRNVAFYNDTHVKRLRAIRHLKQERQMPLARIKAILNSAEFDQLAQRESLQGLERLLPALVDGVAPSPDRRLRDVVVDSNLDEAELEELCDLGVVTPALRDGERWFDFRDCAILRKWGEVRTAGFTVARGYSPAFLKRYLESARALAVEDVDLFLRNFGGDLNVEDAAELAALGVENTSEILNQMRIKALLSTLNERLGAADA